MSFDSAAILFFLLAGVALAALELPRDRSARSSTSERYGWLALVAALAHPLAWWVADAYALQGELTPFLAFDIVAASAMGAAAANRAPGGRAFLPLMLAAACALALGVQQMPWHGMGVSSGLMASVLLCTVLVGTAAECTRQARLDPAVRRPVSLLALLSGTAAILQLVVALLIATSKDDSPHAQQLLAAAGMLWLVLKLALLSTLLTLFAARRAEATDRLSRHLVGKANASMTDSRVIAQAFYQLPGKVLVTDAGGRILFANADARRMLAYPETTDRLLEDLFVAVQPTGRQQVRALFERPDHQAELVQVKMTAVDCGGHDYHLLQMELLPFDYDTLRSLLVDSRNDAPHEASGLLDHHFAIAAMADGWFRLLDPVDRYAASGLFWDKLRILSGSDSEISYLESSIATASEAHGWLRLRNGGGLSVALRKLNTPDHKIFYRAELTLVDDAAQAGAHAPCADGPSATARDSRREARP